MPLKTPEIRIKEPGATMCAETDRIPLHGAKTVRASTRSFHEIIPNREDPSEARFPRQKTQMLERQIIHTSQRRGQTRNTVSSIGADACKE
eukprot:IDg13474t1